MRAADSSTPIEEGTLKITATASLSFAIRQ
jgi:hypothetical protein